MAWRRLGGFAAIAAVVVGFGLPGVASAARSRTTGVSAPGRQVQAIAAGRATAGDPVAQPAANTSDASAAPSAQADAVAGPVTATFSVTYHGFSPAAQTAFQAAVDVWSHLITSAVPITIDASWTNLGNGGILGSAGPTALERDFTNRPVASTWYPVALANAKFGSDIDPSHADVSAQFNSTFSSWYFGTDGNPGASQYDLETIIVHELSHGLGFIGSTDVKSGVGSWGLESSGHPGDPLLPFAYDRFTENGAGTSIIGGFTNNSTALGTQLTSGSVFFDGPKADVANGGNRAQLYAPATWSGGSSYSHLDETAFPSSDPNSLMTPFFSTHEVHHAPGPIVLGVMGDMGWTDLPGIDPSLFTTPSAINFGTVLQPNSADATVVITNVGGSTLTITSSTAPSSPFSATMPANGTNLAGGASLGIPVHFVTTTPGYPTGSLSLQTTGGNATVTLTGAARSHTGTQAYVVATYKDFLNRAPTAGELSSATSQLDGGTVSPTAFVNQLATSPEWVNVIVTGFYQNTLGRPPDSAGLSFWSGAIRNGTYSVAQVAAQFYSSAEYYSGIGGGTDSSWVHDLYLKLLGRPGDSSGVSYWVSRIPVVGRVGVVLPFYQSAESAHVRVAALYSQLLGRAPDQAGWDYWAGQVVSSGDIALATSLATSLEYYNRAQLRFP